MSPRERLGFGSRDLSAAMSARLDRLAEQWSPIPECTAASGRDRSPDPQADDPSSVHVEPHGDAPALRRRLRWQVRHRRTLGWLLMAALVIAAFTWWQGRPVELEGIPGEDVALGQPVGPARGDAIDAVDAGGGAMAGAARAPGGPSSVGGQSGTAPAGAGSRMGSLPGGEGAMVVVHVVGAVASPGVVTLPAGSRVTDAVQAVGGARTTKALASVNLARVLVDGEQIVVDADGLAAATSTVTGSTLSLNRATAADLEDLPGVGPVLAQRIIDWRAAHGPFRTIDELSEVSGIGEALLADLSTRVRP